MVVVNVYNVKPHFVSAPSPETCGLANSVEMYSVLRSQETLLACCLALRVIINKTRLTSYRNTWLHMWMMVNINNVGKNLMCND